MARIPLPRAGTIDEIAAMAAFLCSGEADNITGQSYNVGGGSEMNGVVEGCWGWVHRVWFKTLAAERIPPIGWPWRVVFSRAWSGKGICQAG